ncbi:MAG: tetratricopeptide repeat protein [Bradyrhizobium sp.]|nr:tetratricopeptide repeat protein [Bradyrhizobium sp.]
MRDVMFVAGLAMLMAAPALADSYSDLDQCKFVGQLTKADQSIAACDRIIGGAKATNSSRAAALSSRCGWRWAKQELDRALSDCNEAISVDGSRAETYVNRGNVYVSKGDPDHALSDFNEAIKRDPRGAWAYNARGELYNKMGDLDHAMADFNQSIQLDPNYAMAYRLRGELYKSRGDFEQARADLNQSIRLDPNDALAYFVRGAVSYLRGDNATALADFTASLRLDPSNQATYFNRGVAYYVIGAHMPDAEADFKKAAELDPKDAYAALWLDLATRRNNGESRLREQAAQLDMTAWPAPLTREFIGESDAAQTLAAARDNDPKTSRGRSCEANFYSGEFALLAKNKQQALQMLKRAASDCPRTYIEAPAAMAELIVQR